MENCLYIRTSCEEQGESISNQVQYLQDYCNNNNIKIGETYIDEHSGVNYNRPGLISMLSKCGLKFVSEYNIFIQDKTLPVIHKHIYCKHSSRFSRSVQVLELYQLLLKQGVIIHFVEENRDTTVFNNTTENFIFSIQSLLNAQMSRENSVKVQTGLRSSAARGRILVSGRGIYGYDYDIPNNRLIPNPKEVEVVNKVFQLYLDGLGFKKIANYLNSNNIPCKRGGKWCQESIRTMLMQEKYIGVSIRNRQKKSKIDGDTSVSIRDEKDWVVVKYGDKLPDGSTFTAIPPIVSEEVFAAVQQRIESRKSPKNGKYRGTSILGGKIKCGNPGCGYTYIINTWSAHGITHKFYTCRNRKENGKSVCSNSNVQLDKLEEVLNADWANGLALRNKLLIANSIDLQISSLTSQMDNYSKQDLQSLTEAVIRLEHKKSKLVDYMLQEVISPNDYKLKMEELDLELKDTQTTIDNINSAFTTTKYQIQKLKEKKHKVLKTPINVQYSFEDICKMIKQITVNGHILKVEIVINNVEYVDEVVF